MLDTAALKSKISTMLLLSSGICWGCLWMTEILALPEWWFIGVLALLCGAGCAAAGMIPESWQPILPALLLPDILLMEQSDCRVVLLALCFGAWMGGNTALLNRWRVSRVFCGGLMIGGVIVGDTLTAHLSVSSLALIAVASMILYGGVQIGRHTAFAMTVLAGIVIICWPASEIREKEDMDPGTVISAFSTVLKPDKEILPEVVFIGGKTGNLAECALELHSAANVRFFPELPGAIPENCDMIVAAGVPAIGDGGAAAMLRALKKGGVLVMPVRECGVLSEFEWFVLPGSRGEYAVCAPERRLDLSPDGMDDGLSRLYPGASGDFIPLPGALAGMLNGFESRRVFFGTPVRHNDKCYLLSGFLALAAIMFFARRSGETAGREKGRIFFNCFSWVFFAASLIKPVFAGMMPVTGVRGLTAAAVLIWFFRRPVSGGGGRAFFNRFSGLFSLILLLIFCIYGQWQAALAALLIGGYSFAVLDWELCGPRDGRGESLRFAAAAAGAFAAFAVQYWKVPELIAPVWILILAGGMRFWAWFRN